jgi:hypothetical protein
VREVQAVEPAQAERWRAAQTELAALIREEKQNERGALERARREQAAVDGPGVHADVQAELETAATADDAESDQDAELEI